MAVAFSSVPLPKIVTKDGSFSYQMTANDLLMLGRALNGEESPAGAPRLAWCYAQRYAIGHETYGTFANMVVQHSQVINPSWSSTGTHCKPGGDYYGKPECVGADRRDYNRTRPWESLKSDLQDQLAAWAAGRIPNMIPRGVDFAAVSLVARKIAGRNPEGFQVVHQGPPGNTVVSTTKSRRWPADDYVQLVVGGRTVGVEANYRTLAVAEPLAFVGVLAGVMTAWAARRGV